MFTNKSVYHSDGLAQSSELLVVCSLHWQALNSALELVFNETLYKQHLYKQRSYIVAASLQQLQK